MSIDYQLNKDFDINNLFLNLTFQSPEEEFEYREPLIDHPSNYQMIVTKFFSKVKFPLLQLPESKKTAKLHYNKETSTSLIAMCTYNTLEQVMLTKVSKL